MGIYKSKVAVCDWFRNAWRSEAYRAGAQGA